MKRNNMLTISWNARPFLCRKLVLAITYALLHARRDRCSVVTVERRVTAQPAHSNMQIYQYSTLVFSTRAQTENHHNQSYHHFWPAPLAVHIIIIVMLRFNSDLTVFSSILFNDGTVLDDCPFSISLNFLPTSFLIIIIIRRRRIRRKYKY